MGAVLVVAAGLWLGTIKYSVAVTGGLNGCGWCGDKCETLTTGTVCPDLAPPAGMSCVSQNGGCGVVSTLELMMVGEGQPCGGTTGAQCQTGLVCMAGTSTDKDGTCVKPLTSTVTPTMTPTPGPTSTSTPGPVRAAGDANGDGLVDLVDFAIWKGEYLTGVGLTADFSGDGKVDLLDFPIWKTGYLKK